MSNTEHPRPSATVVLLRDRDAQLEVLMLQKNQAINYGGSWVFPGGVIDDEDYQAASGLFNDNSVEVTAKVTAARETYEESGLTICPSVMTPFAHWITPRIAPKRYATWFFAADANHLHDDVVIDDGEIISSQWFRPEAALADHSEGNVRLNGPSFVTLSELSICNDASSALAMYQARKVNFFEPKALVTKDSIITLYQEDSAYADGELDEAQVLTGTRPLHRLTMRKQGKWEYICQNQD